MYFLINTNKNREAPNTVKTEFSCIIISIWIITCSISANDALNKVDLRMHFVSWCVILSFLNSVNNKDKIIHHALYAWNRTHTWNAIKVGILISQINR